VKWSEKSGGLSHLSNFLYESYTDGRSIQRNNQKDSRKTAREINQHARAAITPSKQIPHRWRMLWRNPPGSPDVTSIGESK